MKKFFVICLIFLFNFITIAPVLAEEPQVNDDGENKVFFSEVEEETIYLDPKSVYELELESDFDVNETSKDDEIFFRLATQVRLSNGMLLPEHTRFAGKFKKIKQSSPLFKRARAYIIVDKLIFPNEKVYNVRMEPKTGSDLKSPQGLNVLRAFPASIGVITFSAIAVACVAVESATVVGLVVVPRTCKGFGLLISSMAKGLNYKAKAGSTILFKLDSPVYVKESDLHP